MLFHSCTSKKGIAKVNIVDGLYIYTNCQPAGKFKTLAYFTVDNFADINKTTGKIEFQTARIKQMHPDANGIILTDTNQGQIIKLK